MLAHVADCLPRLEALIVWESAIHSGLASLAQLRGVVWTRDRPRRLALEASAQSDSLLETLMLHRLRALGLAVRQQVHLLGHRVDFVVGDRLVVQVDGFQHHTGAQRQSDTEHDARLMLEGYRVLRFGYRDVVDRWAHVEDLILDSLTQLGG
jgi:very-short-patch-repair endonuclease